ncbi:DUF3742 family protein [Morganella morganii subsp. morganii]|uniref:DUF3742 family protein n=1 Tax=Morganella morganii TaxID=582 RepID=UPI001BD98A2B|nr:DUF3742 family protein [Morganella morganii]MBT0353507.1 DUF3742 family protein [Morganella morganii subsp. morganii]
MSYKTTTSLGERWGTKLAYVTTWLIKKLKAFDKSCVARAKSKNTPGWLGHIPLVSITLAVIALLTYFSLYILFAFGALVILFSIIANFSYSSSEYIDIDSDVFFANTSFNDDGYRDGIEGTGTYVDGYRIDD